MRISFLSSWGENSEQLLEAYRRQSPNRSGIWENLVGTADLNSADCIVFMEGLPAGGIQSFRNDQVLIGLPREVLPAIKSYQQLNSKYCFTYQSAYHVSTWRIAREFNELAELKWKPKQHACSAVISRLYSTPGQISRVDFLHEFTSRFPNYIDVYGFGWNEEELGGSYRGVLGDRFAPASRSEICKWNGLYPYQYSIACENNHVNNYFTEKLIDCFLSWTIPIYYGCPNITDFFPAESMIRINCLDPDAIDYVKEVIQRPITKLQIDALEEARRLVLYKYNVWPSIAEIAKFGRLSWAPNSPGANLALGKN